MQGNDFYTQLKDEFLQNFRQSMGFHITQFQQTRDNILYNTLRATTMDRYTPAVDLMIPADGACVIAVVGVNEDEELVEFGIYTLNTRDIERARVVLHYIMIAAVLQFHEKHKISRDWGVATATVTDAWP